MLLSRREEMLQIVTRERRPFVMRIPDRGKIGSL
jgi:hypothetical protein